MKNRVLAKFRRKLNLDNLAPKIAAGITEGASAKEALSEHPAQRVDGVELQDMLAAPPERVGRVPVFRAVVKDSLDSVWIDEPTKRLQRDATLLMPPDVREAIRTGWMCLRCFEPQDEAFPEFEDAHHLPGCTYDMRARQAVDVAVEFRGEEHIGPNRGIGAYLEEQSERLERAEYERRKEEGGSPMKAVSRRILSPGAKRLRGLTGKEHASPSVIETIERGKRDAS